MVVRVIDVRGGADGDKHLLPIGGELNVACPVSATEGEVRDVLGRAARFQVAILVGETDDRIGVADVNPLRIGSRRIEGDAVGLFQSGSENLAFSWFASARDSAED